MLVINLLTKQAQNISLNFGTLLDKSTTIFFKKEIISIKGYQKIMLNILAIFIIVPKY